MKLGKSGSVLGLASKPFGIKLGFFLLNKVVLTLLCVVPASRYHWGFIPQSPLLTIVDGVASTTRRANGSRSKSAAPTRGIK